MNALYIEDRTFEKEDLAAAMPARGQYIDCTFNQGDFEKFNFNNYEFVDCVFNRCNLTMATVDNTRLKGVTFNDCKLTGIEFNQCDDFMFAVGYNRCLADYCSFFKKNLKKISFVDCSLTETDFTEADISGGRFTNCNLARATFRDTKLDKADLSTASQYTIDPERNSLKKTIFSSAGLAGLLGKYQLVIV